MIALVQFEIGKKHPRTVKYTDGTTDTKYVWRTARGPWARIRAVISPDKPLTRHDDNGVIQLYDDKPIVTDGGRLARHYHSYGGIDTEAKRLALLAEDCKELDELESWCPIELAPNRLLRAGRLRDRLEAASSECA